MSTLDKANEINDWVIALRRDFHQHPEPSNEEIRTSAIVAEQLQSLGIAVTRIGKTGVLGELVGDLPGKVIALRADMDALSVTEETGLPYSSRVPGMMHACGHDSHTAMLLGAAKVLSAMKATLPGTVKFFFQPAEEIAQGAKMMIANGVMDNPSVDMVYGIHIMPDFPIGKAVVQDGLFMAAADTWKLTVKGVSCHGSSPWQGADALTCTAAIIQSLQTIASRINDARSPVVVNIGTIHGGERFNVVPGSVELTGMNRSFTHASRQQIPEWMEQIIKNTCAAYRCTYDFEYNMLCSPTINDPQVARLVTTAVGKIIGSDNIIETEKFIGSEDCSEFSTLVPGLMMFLGAGNPEKDCCHSLHSNFFKLDEDAISLGVASYVQVALDFLTNQEAQ